MHLLNRNAAQPKRKTPSWARVAGEYFNLVEEGQGPRRRAGTEGT